MTQIMRKVIENVYRQLMNPSTGLLTSPSNADKRPGYSEGFRNAVNEIRQDPMWQKGFNDARNGTVNQQKMSYPYYRQGVQDSLSDDSAGEPVRFRHGTGGIGTWRSRSRCAESGATVPVLPVTRQPNLRHPLRQTRVHR